MHRAAAWAEGAADHNSFGGSWVRPAIFVYLPARAAQGFGQCIVIRHEVDGHRVDTVYGHMYPDGVFVSQGDTVRAGQEIGKIGNNGQSTGPHLHFEIWENGHSSLGGSGQPIDPDEILRRAQGGGGEASRANTGGLD